MPDIQHKRGTRAALDSLAGSSGLLVGQVYKLTDEGRIAVALTTSTYETYASENEDMYVTKDDPIIVLGGDGNSGNREVQFRENDTGSPIVWRVRSTSANNLLIVNKAGDTVFRVDKATDQVTTPQTSKKGALTEITNTPGTNGEEVVVTWTNSDMDAGLAYASGEITINEKAAQHDAMFFIQIAATLANRLGLKMTLEKFPNAGSAWETVAVGTNYATRDSNQNEGNVVISGKFVALTQGDKFRVQIEWTWDSTTAPSIEQDGCYLTLLLV